MNQDLKQLGMIQGRVHHTESFGAVDGPGIRYVFFLQGCPLRCLYCHNPDATPCRGGTLWTAEQAAKEALRYKRFIQNGGVTFSGGEPLIQHQFVYAVSRLLHAEGVHVAVDTAGSEDPARVRDAIDEADLLLLDIKAGESEAAKRLTGRGNENAFRTLDYCESIQKPVWVRHVLLTGWTLDDAQLARLADRLRGYTCIERVELLPFHKLGETKWADTGMQYTLQDTPATTKEQAEAARKIFEQRGFTVQ